jgi:stage II sporulation protein D
VGKVLRPVLASVSLVALGLVGAATATVTKPRAIPPDPGPPAAAPPQSVASTTTTTTTTTPATVTGTVPSTERVSAAPSTVVISGHGWGHGVGLAQWGTLGFARHGWAHDRILAHYYRGTTLERRPAPTVRVLLVEGAKRVRLASESGWSVTDARGAKVALEAGKLTLGAGLLVAGQTLSSPLTVNPGATPVSVRGKPYRGGLQVFSNGKKLEVVNALGLEEYVRGVVGLEVPSNWPSEALKAQAVVARSYALASLSTDVSARAYDLFADTRSQVYGGIEAESDPVTRAVDATAGQVVVFDGKVATTYYSSSSGGRTTSAEEAFGKPVPYLVSVPDPYDTLSPYHDWGPVLFDARKLGKALKVGAGLVSLDTIRDPSGHVTKVTAVGPAGEVSSDGASIRFLLGLRSTAFTVGFLALQPPAKVAFGADAQLDGTARGVGAVTLEARPKGRSWQTVGTVEPDARGAFTMLVRPEETTQYRLAAGDLRAGLVTVPVEPVVEAAVASGAVAGTVRPPLAGAPVQLQRRSGASWSTVATATTDPSGSYAVSTSLAPGSYRVRFAPGGGLSPGVSPSLAVS